MRNIIWIPCLVSCLATTAAAESFLPRALDPQRGIEVLGRADARRLVNRDLFADPAASAVFGEVHLYDRYPWIEARYVHVTSDAAWGRLLYGEPGAMPRALDTQDGRPLFVEPRGLSFAPDGHLFVADRAAGTVTMLQLGHDASGPRLDVIAQLGGFQQPMDVAYHDGGTPADASDDRLLVAEAGAHRVVVMQAAAQGLNVVGHFGSCGPQTGEFLYPRSVAVGHAGGAATDRVYVADAGNHRLVELQLDAAGLTWKRSTNLPMEATSVDTDHHGNLYLTLRRQNRLWKLTPGFEKVAEWSGEAARLVAPRDVAIPFVWVHDHRGGATAAPEWRGQGSALVLEAWGDHSGVQRLDLGVEIVQARRAAPAQLEVHLSDPAQTEVTWQDARGVPQHADLGVLAAGRNLVDVAGMENAESITLTSKSLYDPTRSDRQVLGTPSVAPLRSRLLQNVPNPFNPTTRIAFDLARAGHATLDVFDVRGRHVRRLLDADLAAGRHDVTWLGDDAGGRPVASGIYFYRLEADGFVSTRKMVMAQ